MFGDKAPEIFVMSRKRTRNSGLDHSEVKLWNASMKYLPVLFWPNIVWWILKVSICELTSKSHNWKIRKFKLQKFREMFLKFWKFSRFNLKQMLEHLKFSSVCYVKINNAEIIYASALMELNSKYIFCLFLSCDFIIGMEFCGIIFYIFTLQTMNKLKIRIMHLLTWGVVHISHTIIELGVECGQGVSQGGGL